MRSPGIPQVYLRYNQRYMEKKMWAYPLLNLYFQVISSAKVTKVTNKKQKY